MKVPCEDCCGKYCICDACQSMREALENFSSMNTDEVFDKE